MLKVNVVGSGFAPSPKMNVVLGVLLDLAPAPDFENDGAACRVQLAAYCDTVTCHKTLSGEHVAVFDAGGLLCITVPFREESYALCAALHHALSCVSHD